MSFSLSARRLLCRHLLASACIGLSSLASSSAALSEKSSDSLDVKQPQNQEPPSLWAGKSRGGGAHQVLKHRLDRYDGCLIDDPRSLPETRDEFNSKLKHSLDVWREEKKRGVWLTLSPERVAFAADAISQHGFELHSANREQLTLTKWLPLEQPNTLPAGASHYVGVGCLLLNKTKNSVLVVQEKNGVLKGKNFWKIPTGAVDAGEDLMGACQRELMEETGIRAKVKGLVLVRQLTRYLGGKGDLFFVFLCELEDPDSEGTISIQESEIAACQWMPVEDYFAQSLQALWPAGRVAYTIMNECFQQALEHKGGSVWAVTPYESQPKPSSLFHPPLPANQTSMTKEDKQ